MPAPNTSQTILSLLGMLVGGFGKGAMMAEMAQDKDTQAKKEAKEKRVQGFQDKMLDAGIEYMLNPENPLGGRNQMWGSIQSLYSNLAGEDSEFPYKEPYQMTPEENARRQMEDPVTFRHGMTQMLKRDEVDPKLPYQIKEIESRIKLNNQRLVNLRRKKDTTNQIKRLDPYVKQKYDLLIKRAEFVAKELKQYEGMREGYRVQHEDIIKELVEEMNQYLDDAEKLLVEGGGDVYWSDYEY